MPCKLKSGLILSHAKVLLTEGIPPTNGGLYRCSSPSKLGPGVAGQGWHGAHPLDYLQSH